ncbi:PREDICTED: uncharacterized protein LOC109185298 [Ipomoea nil]|uniref:uncharacterized protein LOC109185298 n=1 Tax=Ipomoea nil TaxID=35883 RepID=UPI00090185B0|nr:PREDICTED: uncharacterized protein LOC109185298 [Ipomoea nil]
MPMYVPVKDIGPLDREKAIRVKCVRCYEIAENRGSTEIKSREVLVCDKEGTFIHLNMQNSDVQKYKNVFIEGKLYSTQVKAIKSKGFPNKMFQLKNYDSLKDPTQVNDKVLFDLIGRVVEIHAPVDKIIGGRPAKLLDFKMADNQIAYRGNTLPCTVWDSHVASMVKSDTSCYNATQLHLNGPYQEFVDFKSQLSASHSPLRSISTATVLSQSQGIDDFNSGALTVTPVADLLKKKQNGEFYVPAEIVGIEGSFGWMYISCMSPGCNRKLSGQVGDFSCTHCNKKYQEGMARYRVKVIVLDKGQKDAPFLLWDRECSELVGIPAHSLYLKYNKVSDIPAELEFLVGMRMIFKISLKMEFMKGANSAYTVMRVLRDEVPKKDLMTKMIDEDEEEDEESDQEASNGENEVNSPLSIQHSQSVDLETDDSNGVKRSLLDQFSSSRKKGKNVVKKEKV